MVYVISDGLYIKIGVTKDTIRRRVGTLQTGNPRKLIPVYEIHTDSFKNDCKLEKVLHNEFYQYMIMFEGEKPTEWFDKKVMKSFDVRNHLFWKGLNMKHGTNFKVEVLDGNGCVQLTKSREKALKKAMSCNLYEHSKQSTA